MIITHSRIRHYGWSLSTLSSLVLQLYFRNLSEVFYLSESHSNHIGSIKELETILICKNTNHTKHGRDGGIPCYGRFSREQKGLVIHLKERGWPISLFEALLQFGPHLTNDFLKSVQQVLASALCSFFSLVVWNSVDFCRVIRGSVYSWCGPLSVSGDYK